MERLHILLNHIVETVFLRLRLPHTEEKIKAVVQFLGFCIVGVSNTLLSYGLNVLALLLLKPYAVRWDYFAANGFAFVLSVLWSFYWNNKYVFTENKSGRSVWRTLLKTYVSYSVTGLILSNILSYVFIQWMGISKYIAPMLNLLISVPVNFLINKFWAFRAEQGHGGI